MRFVQDNWKYLIAIYLLLVMPVLAGVIGWTLNDGGIAMYGFIHGTIPRPDISFGIGVHHLFRIMLGGVLITTVSRIMAGRKAAFFVLLACLLIV